MKAKKFDVSSRFLLNKIPTGLKTVITFIKGLKTVTGQVENMLSKKTRLLASLEFLNTFIGNEVLNFMVESIVTYAKTQIHQNYSLKIITEIIYVIRWEVRR